MGIFDEIHCDAPLPDTAVPFGIPFQTKSLFCGMENYTITVQGRLIYNETKGISDGEIEIRPGLLIPRWRSVGMQDIDLEYHGDIRFYGNAPDHSRLDYVARFTHGKLEWIRRFEELPEMHRTWFYSKG